MPHCECGAHVSADYVRVLGDPDEGVDACPHCASGADILNNAAHPATDRGHESVHTRRERSEMEAEADA